MHVCLFDIDGTLLNTGGAGQAAMEAAMREQFGEREPIAGISYAGRTDRGIIQDIFRFYRLDFSEDVRSRFVAAYLRHLPGELARRPGLILPGVVELLSHLHKREDVTLGLLTGNLLEGARRKLQHHGLDDYFDFALGAFGDEHVDRDDVARAALAILSNHSQTAARLSLERLWVIGDTPADIRCARAIGAKALAVATGIYARDVLQKAEPDRLVDSFEDAEALLDLWL
jgi:phosphoglycolate phosphatase-like HAD superfamily hydrolase